MAAADHIIGPFVLPINMYHLNDSNEGAFELVAPPGAENCELSLR